MCSERRHYQAMTQDEEREKLLAWEPILDDLGDLIARTLAQSTGMFGETHDPSIVSFFLLRRLRGHRDAFATLINAGQYLDSEIIVRAAVETAICLVNLNVRREAFITDLRSDAARTVKGQVPIWYDSDPELGEEARAGIDTLFGATRADGTKHTGFAWERLANEAAVPQLYRWYKHLSGTSAHVTGVSIFLNDFPVEEIEQLRRMRRTIIAMPMMCGAAVIGGRAHANTLGYIDLEAEAEEIMVRMSKA
jgi:hypothetical protein